MEQSCDLGKVCECSQVCHGDTTITALVIIKTGGNTSYWHQMMTLYIMRQRVTIPGQTPIPLTSCRSLAQPSLLE